MSKKFGLWIITLGLTVPGLCGCSSLHVHSYEVDYQHDEETHWQICDKCGEKFNYDVHAFNSYTDTCLICNYADPTVIADEDGVMTGLTRHGKTKYEIDVPSSVKYIGKDAFKDSNVTKVNIPKELIGYYDGAFDDEKISIHTDEEEVVWTYSNGIYYKHNLLEDYEAMVDGVAYESIYKAFEDIYKDGQTITLLKEDLTLEKPLYVNRILNLESYYDLTNLSCEFNIAGSGILNIADSVNYSGNVKLILVDVHEEIYKAREGVRTSGAVAFIDKEEKPENVLVEYVHDFHTEAGFGYEAVGSKQVVNDLLVVPVNQYAYGSFAFSGDFRFIKGLSPYGDSISELHITNVVKNIQAEIAPYAFTIYTDIKINIAVIPDTHITYNATKGSFTSLFIDKGITKIGDHAFSNETTSDIFHEVKKMISILCRIQSVYIGDSVTHIDVSAFASSLSIREVYGGRGLKTIDRYAFYECIDLRSADFSQALSLTTIKEHAFEYCDNFVQLYLPTDGWVIDGQRFFPHQFTPDVAAYHAQFTDNDVNWTRELAGNVCYTKSLRKDGCERFNDVGYASTITEAVNYVCDGGWVYITDKVDASQKHITMPFFPRNLNIVAYPGLEGVTIGSKDTPLYITKNYYLTLDNVTPLGDVCINCTMKAVSDVSTSFEDLAAFCMKAEDNDTYLNTHVYFRDPSSDKKVEARYAPVAFTEGIEYMGCGALSFTYDSKSKQVLFWRTSSVYGGITKIHLDNPLLEEEDYPVTHVGASNDIFKESKNIRIVSMADCVDAVGIFAFAGCTNLLKVTFGKNMNTIMGDAFNGCTKLQRVEFGEGGKLRTIQANAFAGCTNLEWFDFGENVANWCVNTPTPCIIVSTLLLDPYNAAQLIKEHAQYDWTRWGE
ncbi:MAG: leucine-rich repeat domain-containing protein [Bacilli bacterium]|nr:leucine-rich repeat domain-containing protein [Bacilli bacterium]